MGPPESEISRGKKMNRFLEGSESQEIPVLGSKNENVDLPGLLDDPKPCGTRFRPASRRPRGSQISMAARNASWPPQGYSI